MMRLRTFIWIACLINLGLILSIVRQGKQTAPTGSSTASPTIEAKDKPSGVTTNAARAATPTTNNTAAAAPAVNWPPFRWEQVESDNYLQLIGNLRRIGCPDDTVRDIVTARVLDDYADTAWDVQKTLQPGFWEMVGKADDIRDIPISKQIEDRLEKIQAEKRATLAEVEKALTKEKSVFRLTSDRWSFLSAELREQVRDIHGQIEEKRTELREELREAKDPKLQESLRQSLRGLDEARDEAIKTIIGEENWARYDATRSRNANWLRTLPGLVATPEELQQIAVEQEALSRERKPRPRNATPEELDEYQLKMDNLTRRENEVLVRVLGDERASHVDRAADSDYLTMRRVARRHGLPLDIANRAYEVKQSARAQLDAALAQNLNDERRLQATAALLLAVKAELAGIYGEQAWPSYEKYGMGWFEDLTQSAQKVEEEPGVSDQ